MVDGDGPHSISQGDRRPQQRLVVGCRALIAPLAGALCFLGGATSALAMSGEDEFSIQLSGAASCPDADLDALHVCFQGGGEETCELFDVETPSTALSSLLCPLRSVLLNPEVVPQTGSVENSPGPIRGMSTGYLRALRLNGATDPTYAVTQSLGAQSSTVEVAKVLTTGGDVCVSPKPTVFSGTASDAFCTALTNALPRLGVSTGEIVLAVGYRYENDALASLFSTDQFMTVWACGARQARCIKGSAAPIAAGGAVVLDEIWLRNWLTNSGLRIWR